MFISERIFYVQHHLSFGSHHYEVKSALNKLFLIHNEILWFPSMQPVSQQPLTKDNWYSYISHLLVTVLETYKTILQNICLKKKLQLKKELLSAHVSGVFCKIYILLFCWWMWKIMNINWKYNSETLFIINNLKGERKWGIKTIWLLTESCAGREFLHSISIMIH